MDSPHGRARNDFYENFHDEDGSNFDDNDDASPRTHQSSMSGLRMILAAVVIILAYYIQRLQVATPQSTTTDLSVCARSQLGDCHRIPTPASFRTTLPLPYPVDKLVHEVVLHEIGWSEPEKEVNNIVGKRDLVILRLNESVSTIQVFVKDLAHTRPKGDYTFFALIEKVKIVQIRLDAVLEAVDVLNTLYASMKIKYDELTLSSIEALQKSKWSPLKSTAMKNQLPLSRWLFGDLSDKWGAPYKQNLKKAEEARSGVTALDQESRRILQIELLFRELRCIAEVLETSVNQWRADFSYDNLYDDGIGQERLRVWFQQNVYQNPLLMKLWDELSSSVNKAEEGLRIEFTTEWCGS